MHAATATSDQNKSKKQKLCVFAYRRYLYLKWIFLLKRLGWPCDCAFSVGECVHLLFPKGDSRITEQRREGTNCLNSVCFPLYGMDRAVWTGLTTRMCLPMYAYIWYSFFNGILNTVEKFPLIRNDSIGGTVFLFLILFHSCKWKAVRLGFAFMERCVSCFCFNVRKALATVCLNLSNGAFCHDKVKSTTSFLYSLPHKCGW